jgi:parvulin-like peptidyl-prolyl isomerase
MTGRIKALGAFFAVAAVVAGCGSGVPGNSVADIAGNPITAQAFNHWLLVAAKSQAASQAGSPVIIPDPPQFNRCIAEARHDVPSLAKTPTKSLRLDCKQLFTTEAGQVMQLLIQGYWYQLEAVRDHVKVSDAEVNKTFDAAKTQNFHTDAQFNAYLSQTGQTLADILFRFRVSAIEAKLVTKATKKITPALIQQYYNAHKSQFGTQQSLNVRLVLTKTAAQANTVRRAIQSGQSWSKVAKRYSTDPTTKANGGLLVGMTKGQADPALAKAAFAAPLNKLLGPVKGQFGYYVFEVIKNTPASQQSLAQATALIRQTLVGQQQTNAQNTLATMLRKHWLGQTSCRAAYNTTVYCKGYKAPKAPTTSTG